MLGSLIKEICFKSKKFKVQLIDFWKSKSNDTTTKVFLSFSIILLINLIFKSVVNYYNSEVYTNITSFVSIDMGSLEVMNEIQNMFQTSKKSNVYLFFQSFKINMIFLYSIAFVFFISLNVQYKFDNLKLLLCLIIVFSVITLSLNFISDLMKNTVLYGTFIPLILSSIYTFISIKNKFIKSILFWSILIVYFLLGAISLIFYLCIIFFGIFIILYSIILVFLNFTAKLIKSNREFEVSQKTLYVLLFFSFSSLLSVVFVVLISFVYPTPIVLGILDKHIYIEYLKQIPLFVEIVFKNSILYQETIICVTLCFLISLVFYWVLSAIKIKYIKSYNLENEYFIMMFVITLLIPNFLNTFIIMPFLLCYLLKFMDISAKNFTSLAYDALIIIFIYYFGTIVSKLTYYF